MMGIGANFTTREVASSANSCANCNNIRNRFPWFHIVFSLIDAWYFQVMSVKSVCVCVCVCVCELGVGAGGDINRGNREIKVG